MIFKVFGSLSALALCCISVAQIPVPRDPPQCGGMERKFPSWSVPPLAPRYQERLPVSRAATDLCSEYTHSGWKNTLKLRLGEGAEDYKPLIELAIKRWNEALEGFNQKPVVEISRLRPTSYSLHDDFWHRYNTSSELDESNDLIDDGQSVIYFKGNDPENRFAGFAYSRWDDKSMQEADIYINLTSTEQYSPFIVETQELATDESGTAYAAVLSIYTTILHEIGHALGLNHVPVSGNVMSYNYMPYMAEKWQIPAYVELLRSGTLQRSFFSAFISSDPDISKSYYFEDPTEEQQSAALFYTITAGLGEQDRMSLLCAYDFSDWNH